MKYALIFTVLISLNVHAEEETPAPSWRSSADKHIWISGHGGLEGGWWGINSGGGIGGRAGASLRVQVGRCGGLFEWNDERITYYQPDPHSHLRVVGAGVACEVLKIGEKSPFWHGSHFLTRALIEYASNEYDLADGRDRPVSADTAYGWGGQIGADFMFPIYAGFWAFAGSGIEALQFKYTVPQNNQGVRDGGGATWNFFFHVGLSFGFL